MPKTILKDHLSCPCEGVMFPFSINTENGKVTYKCIRCGSVLDIPFDDAKLDDDAPSPYFVLNDAGVVTWKCFTDGYCEFMLDDLWVGDRLTRFLDLGCAMCRYPDEIKADMEPGEHDKTRLMNILSALSPDQIGQLLDAIGTDGDSMDSQAAFDACMFCYSESACYDEYEGFSDFIETVQTTVFDLFEIEFDEDGNIFEL